MNLNITDLLKKIIFGILLLFSLMLLLGFVLGKTAHPPETDIVKFIENNPDRSAIKWMRNDSVVVDNNSDKMMCLASTVKIILAIEYAEQAASKKIDPDQMIPIRELDKFYIPNTDGGAYPRWLKSFNDKIEDRHISIRNIVKGMIWYSSNANTEWLCKKLGLENINTRLEKMEVKNHDKIFYPVSALFVGKEKFPDLKNDKLTQELRAMTMEEYHRVTYIIQEKLLKDPDYKSDLGSFGFDVQRVWSDNLPSSTTAEYVDIMRKINSRSYFIKETQQYLDDIMERLLLNPKNRSWLNHAGMKGGSTSSVLTKALYTTDTKGNTTEMAYFFNDLERDEVKALSGSMNSFELDVIKNRLSKSDIIAISSNYGQGNQTKRKR